jgi:outer membrane scaffolding protein for murein synthesis (MipA/OmpV family)
MTGQNQGSTVLSTFLTHRRACLLAGALAMLCAAPALAEDENDGGGLFSIFDKPTPETRTRIGIGPGFAPSYPGADDSQIYPLIEFERVTTNRQFDFEAPDESFGFDLINAGGFSFGPVVSFEDSRTSADVGTTLPKVGWSIEPGAFVQYDFGDNFRLRSELRKGVTGHDGWIGMAGADLIARDGDKWLFSIGPRVTWADDTYHDAYFSVTPAACAGLRAFRVRRLTGGSWPMAASSARCSSSRSMSASSPTASTTG